MRSTLEMMLVASTSALSYSAAVQSLAPMLRQKPFASRNVFLPTLHLWGSESNREPQTLLLSPGPLNLLALGVVMSDHDNSSHDEGEHSRSFAGEVGSAVGVLVGFELYN